MGDEHNNENVNEKNVDIKNDYEYREIRKSDIIIPDWLPRKPIIVTNADRDLKGSIKGSGLLNPVTVLETKDGKFELLAGSRRFAATESDTIWVHIKKYSSDYKARLTSGTENFHRKDTIDIARDDFYYQTYLIGIANKEIKTIRDMAKDASMSKDTLSKYIKAGEERAKNKNNDIINKASTSSLHNTKSLKNIPKVRNKLLELEQQKIIFPKNIPEITERIGTCVNKGMTERMISKMIDMSISNPSDPSGSPSNTQVNINTNNTNGIGNNDSTNNTNDIGNTNGNDNINKKINLPLDMNEFDTISYALAISHPDVREYIISKKIDIEDASEINRFEKIEERRQLMQERIKFKTLKLRGGNVYENEWKKNLDIRKQQVEEIKERGDTELKTWLDIQHQRQLDLEKTKDERYDEDMIKKYFKLKGDINSLISYHHPQKLKTERGKEIVPDIIKGLYQLFRQVLIDIGEINVDNNGPGFIDIDVKSEEVK